MFCCKEIQTHLKEKEVAISYSKKFRTYGIKVLDGGCSVQQIHYCPWCGEKLPSDLSEELAKIVFDKLQLNGFNDPRLPAEFKSDKWWRHRGL